MSSKRDCTLSLFNLHGQAVALRDRADTITERSDVLLLHIERAFTQQLLGEPVVLGIRPKPAPMTPGAALPAPGGAGLCPAGAHRAQPGTVPQSALDGPNPTSIGARPRGVTHPLTSAVRASLSPGGAICFGLP